MEGEGYRGSNNNPTPCQVAVVNQIGKNKTPIARS